MSILKYKYKYMQWRRLLGSGWEMNPPDIFSYTQPCLKSVRQSPVRRCQHYLGIFWHIPTSPRAHLASSSYSLCHHFMFLSVSACLSGKYFEYCLCSPSWNFQLLVATTMWFRHTLPNEAVLVLHLRQHLLHITFRTSYVCNSIWNPGKVYRRHL